MVFTCTDAASPSKELHTVPYISLQAGDVSTKRGSPGHIVTIVDVAIHPEIKEKAFLLVQSYMPAQQIYILVDPADRNLSPWYELINIDSGRLYIPE